MKLLSRVARKLDDLDETLVAIAVTFAIVSFGALFFLSIAFELAKPL